MWTQWLRLDCSWTRRTILAAGKGRRWMFFFSVSLLSFIFLLLPCPFLSSPLLSLLILFFLALGEDTKWHTRIDVSLNPSTINQSINQSIMWTKFTYVWYLYACIFSTWETFHILFFVKFHTRTCSCKMYAFALAQVPSNTEFRTYKWAAILGTMVTGRKPTACNTEHTDNVSYYVSVYSTGSNDCVSR